MRDMIFVTNTNEEHASRVRSPVGAGSPNAGGPGGGFDANGAGSPKGICCGIIWPACISGRVDMDGTTPGTANSPPITV